MTSLIEMRNITKEFRGIAALKNVNFDLHKGEIHSIVGENGAGKSTLTKIMAGVTTATAGSMTIEGRPVSFRSPADALRNGVTMVFQEISLVPSMTVAQNIYLGDEKLFNRLRGIYISAQTFLSSMNFIIDPWATVSTLGAAKKQMVEIARAVRQNAHTIIFDEPTASLTPEEKYYFFSLMQNLKQRGVSIVFISHALEEALQNADTITILRDGELVISDKVANFDRDKIIRAMVGRTLTNEIYSRKKGVGDTRRAGVKVLSVQNVSMGKMVRNNSFTVYAGQITGMFGLIGAGRTETAKILSGVMKRDFFYGGEVRLLGRPVRYAVPRPAVRDGIVYVTEDRKLEGFFETMSIAENLHMGQLAADLNSGVIVRMSEMRELAATWSASLKIRAINSNARVIELSGGNQQKVTIARSLVQKPKAIIFDEPTRGVDVGAIVEIHQLINRLANQGIAVVVISSYLPEVMNLSDRILVYRAGRVVEEFSPAEATEERIMYAAVH
jgi:simple sugar transport system ATP-binding protein